MIRISEQQARHFTNAAYIAAFNARSPAEVALDLLDHQDGRWTREDRARRGELVRALASREA
ncbi:hypothetical protein [Taklimakanibacter deserti]|uniref:hypothetical protein n=1 Tax=Taklimakanibacter deserti TaxID=2267839 RepID=UPI0034D41A0C